MQAPVLEITKARRLRAEVSAIGINSPDYVGSCGDEALILKLLGLMGLDGVLRELGLLH